MLLTAKDADDGAQVGPLLDQVSGPLASFTADGAYDQDGVAASIGTGHPGAAIIVPPRSNAVSSDTAETAPTQRDRHLQHIAEHGRMAWQKASGYTKRALAETGMGPLQGSCSSPPVDLECLSLCVRRLDVTLALGIQGWDDRTS